MSELPEREWIFNYFGIRRKNGCKMPLIILSYPAFTHITNHTMDLIVFSAFQDFRSLFKELNSDI